MNNDEMTALIKVVNKLGFTVVEVKRERRDGIFAPGNNGEANETLVVRLLPRSKRCSSGGTEAKGDER
jgi:hypothetical protein